MFGPERGTPKELKLVSVLRIIQNKVDQTSNTDLSMLIQHRCNMEHVDAWTSKEFHKSHMLYPNSHFPVISTEALNGMAMSATRMSATASETTK